MSGRARKPPYGRLTAIDMNAGEHLWWIPNGDTPERIKNHPLLEGVDLTNINSGFQGNATALVTRSLLMFSKGRGGQTLWFDVDKMTRSSRKPVVRRPVRGAKRLAFAPQRPCAYA